VRELQLPPRKISCGSQRTKNRVAPVEPDFFGKADFELEKERNEGSRGPLFAEKGKETSARKKGLEIVVACPLQKKNCRSGENTTHRVRRVRGRKKTEDKPSADADAAISLKQKKKGERIRQSVRSGAQEGGKRKAPSKRRCVVRGRLIRLGEKEISTRFMPTTMERKGGEQSESITPRLYAPRVLEKKKEKSPAPAPSSAVKGEQQTQRPSSAPLSKKCLPPARGREALDHLLTRKRGRGRSLAPSLRYHKGKRERGGASIVEVRWEKRGGG